MIMAIMKRKWRVVAKKSKEMKLAAKSKKINKTKNPPEKNQPITAVKNQQVVHQNQNTPNPNYIAAVNEKN